MSADEQLPPPVGGAVGGALGGALGGAWLAAALGLFLALVWRFDFLCDDAYITFRFARNLAAGRGLVFNPGVDPPVEGYSEFAWALVLAGGLKLGLSPMLLSRALSVAAGVGTLLLTARLLGERAAGTRRSTGGALLFLALAPPLAVWSTGGLATLPFALGVLGLFSLVWRRDEPAAAWKLGALSALCVLLRAEGAWWVAWTLGPAIVLGWARRRPVMWRRALGGAAIAVVVFGAHLAWRWATYGDWLPNTARVKVGLSARSLERGADYLAHALLTFPGIALAVAAGLAGRGWGERRVLPALLLVGASALHALAASGDFMAFGRFLVPALPFAALLLGAGLARLEGAPAPPPGAGRRGAAAAALVAGLCALTNLLPAFERAATPRTWRRAFAFRHNDPAALERSELAQWRRMNLQADEWVDLGKALKRVSEPGDSLVYGAVGAVGYFSDLFLYDMNGLVTREVALRPPLANARSPGHDKSVPREFFARYRPTYLYAFWYPRSEAELRVDPKLRELGLDPAVLEVVPLPPAESPRPAQLLVVWRGDA